MDGQRFDRFARIWAEKRTRRRVLWSAAKGALVAATASRATTPRGRPGRIVRLPDGHALAQRVHPRHVFNKDGSEWTQTLEAGRYEGDTVLPAPPFLPFGNSFHTDQRTFDDRRAARSASGGVGLSEEPTSRMRSEITIDLVARTVVGPPE